MIFTVGYGWSAEGTLVIEELPEESRFIGEVTLFNGGGGLVSSTIDYLKFCQMLLNKGIYDGKRILNEETIELMLTDHLEEIRQYQERLSLPAGEASFGLGFAIKGDSSGKLEEVYGWGGAVGTFFKIDTKNELAYVLMIQLSPYRQLGLRQLYQEYVNASILEQEK